MKEQSGGGLKEFGDMVGRVLDDARIRHDKQVDEWDSKAGARVHHPIYLLDGTLTGGLHLHLGNTARVCIKWDNGATSIEMPCNIEFVGRELNSGG